MNKETALRKMISPGMKRSRKPNGGVIQIHVTRACDKACYNCTQGSNLRGPYSFISLDNFRIACESLRDYFGIVGVFGGNPALHPNFDELCSIMREIIPYNRRGLWCNNLLGKGEHARKTFNPHVSNLNVHLDSTAWEEFRRDWPESLPFGLERDSRHSPVHLAMSDVIEDEEKRWKLISKCDINQHWSAMIAQVKGKLRGYFCEIAGAQAILHPDWPDKGVDIEPGWWKKTMEDFAEQVSFHCHRCAVPLRGYGALACGVAQVEQTSQLHEEIYKPKRKSREVQVVDNLVQINSKNLLFTDYLGGAVK